MKYNFNKITNLRLNAIGYITLKSFITYINVLCWSLGLDKDSAHVLRDRITHLWNTNGKTFTVMYLKECVLIFQHYIGGQLIHLSKDIPIGISGGLPSIIPGSYRRLIRRGDVRIIKGVFSILSVYRIMQCPGVLKLNTITDPFTGQEQSLPLSQLGRSILSILQVAKIDSPKLGNIDLHLSSSAGPNKSSSLLSIYYDLVAWTREENWSTLKWLAAYAAKHPNGADFMDLYFPPSNRVIWNQVFKIPEANGKDKSCTSERLDDQANGMGKPSTSTWPVLGKLHLKEEAAGKIRVFAIADVITQSVLAPLHKCIFKILKNIPMDGTFDQIAPIQRLQQRLMDGKYSDQLIYSYDLSAATDRLPAILQRDILGILFKDHNLATGWYNIMTQRDWLLPSTPSFREFVPEDIMVRYSVGQPMGALSSWGMLAFTHHVLVDIAAKRIGLGSFDDYAILGDDIVIANTAVAGSYHYLMTTLLGVQISIHKSLVSKNTFEFAKQLIRGPDNLSPIGPKNILLSIKSMNGILSLFTDMINKGVVLTEQMVTDMFTNGIPTVSRKKQEVTKWTILGPFGLVPTVDGLTSSMKLVNSLSMVRVDSLLSSIDDVLHLRDVQNYWKVVEKTLKAFIRVSIWDPKKLFYDLDGTHQFIDYIQEEISYIYFRKLKELSTEEPKRRYIFGGPIIHFNHYREGWMREVMLYIRSKINTPETNVSIMDPFDIEDRIILPWKSKSSGDSFFGEVRKLEQLKDQDRNSFYFRD